MSAKSQQKPSIAADVRRVLDRLGVPDPISANGRSLNWANGGGRDLAVRTPINGQQIATFATSTASDVDEACDLARHAFDKWRMVPAPHRGEFVRLIGQRLREVKNDLAELVTLESGKIRQEALGEVQEMIDICDFAVGLSRQLYGRTIASERPLHRMSEQYHPLGPIGVISAFNFPVAVWSWNAAIAVVCGDSVVWKPSEKTPLCAIACHALCNQVAMKFPDAPNGLLQLVQGGVDVGQSLAASRDLPLISATGSVTMGRAVGEVVAQRLGRSLLELGGNNAAIVTPTADLSLALRAIVFAAFGTCGQRCTSLRRLIVHESVADELIKRIKQAAASLNVGDPRSANTHIGPLIDQAAFDTMQQALVESRAAGAKIEGGLRIANGVPEGGVYVRPAIAEINADAPVLQRETFAPILFCIRYRDFNEAIAIQNGVSQGLSSAVFTSNVSEAELFCSAAGSDCGIANVNIGTSGAEIGGAFGGDKDTGGGRESGSDSWKVYMRRVTNTINYSSELPLAQGVKFDF